MKDGYPNFGNFASGLSILEIPPLDLKQVEIIKGSVSTLYGGGAIAGVVNFISKTRTSRTIQNAPTRVETIELEEIDEKSNMRPSNVSMILHESTGIQVQQTSATSANASIRIQGLDGRYTQLLKDGYPNFGNFASGLSINVRIVTGKQIGRAHV